MADTLTTNFGFNKPDLSASNDTWGAKLNGDLDSIDSLIFSNQTKVNAVEALIQSYLPYGIIAIWNGSLTSIPAHWHLCDGTTGTTDLRDKMIMGAGLSYGAGVTGGTNNHVHTVYGTGLSVDQLPPHGHAVNDSGHSHGVSDPGHNHYVNDPGHSHTYLQDNQNNTNLISNGTAFRANAGGSNAATGGSGTGIYLNASGANISINASGTGIYLSNTGSGNTHTHGMSIASHIPPFVALGFIQRI